MNAGRRMLVVLALAVGLTLACESTAPVQLDDGTADTCDMVWLADREGTAEPPTAAAVYAASRRSTVLAVHTAGDAYGPEPPAGAPTGIERSRALLRACRAAGWTEVPR